MPAGRAVPAAAMGLVAAAALLLPWWEARPPVLLGTGASRPLDGDVWAGWEVAGPLRAAAVVALAVAAAVAAGRSRRWPAGILTAAAGGAAAGAGAAALVERGVTTAPGAWVAVAAGLGAVALVLRGVAALVPALVVALLAVTLVAAVAVPVLPGAPQPDAGTTDGPFVRLAGLEFGELRSGEPGLPATLSGIGLTTVSGRVVLTSDGGIVGLDDHGRSEVLARLATGGRGRIGTVLGAAGDRVARWVAADAVAVSGLRAGDPLAVTVRDVAAAGPVGSDGSLWLRSYADPDGTVRRLDLAVRGGEQVTSATYLPVVTIGVPDGAADLDLTSVTPADGGGVRFVQQGDGRRLERLTPSPTGVDVAVLAGGRDPACGASRAGREAYLPRASPLAVDPAGAVWFALEPSDGTPGTLVRLGPDGALRAVPHRLPGTVAALAVAGDGAVVILLRDGAGGLWQLPDAAGALTDLPASPPGCVAAPPPAGPPVVLTPVGNAGRASPDVLDIAGRWASTGTGDAPALTAVSTGGQRVPLGGRRGGSGPVRPDGSGGAWWLDPVDGGDRVALVHGRPGEAQQASPAVPNPAPLTATTLLTDLGGRPPLLATPTGAYRITGGAAVRVVEGDVRAGIGRADGHGWVLADGRLLALDGDRVLGPVIDAGDRRGDRTPVAVQLAKGVAPAQLALPDAAVALDGGGRCVVVSGGVVLAVDDGGAVAPVADDVRLTGPVAVEGGLVQVHDGILLRVDLPG